MNLLPSNNLKALFLDLGGVIIDIDPGRAFQKIKQLGTNAEEKITLNHPLFKQYETGQLTDTQFYDQACSLWGLNISNDEFLDIWNSLLLDIPKERTDFIFDLSQNYSLFLLSNTNPIHLRVVKSMYRDVSGRDMEDDFDKLYLSYEMQCRKPDIEIYEQAIVSSGYNAENCLFCDDLIENIRGAKAVGLSGYHIYLEQDLLSLKKYI
ncbi:MAG: HAD family phosphatase [Cyclobacteriaceae bacterium]|nr:HAD family phosphatase [Cyclobacteriaceae bacterium]MCH8514904.1 HAD family phosphatase [Cyclobacteriaceae bacterium]